MSDRVEFNHAIIEMEWCVCPSPTIAFDQQTAVLNGFCVAIATREHMRLMHCSTLSCSGLCWYYCVG